MLLYRGGLYGGRGGDNALRDGVLLQSVLSPGFLDERHVCRQVVVHVELCSAGVEDGDVGRHFESKCISLLVIFLYVCRSESGVAIGLSQVTIKDRSGRGRDSI